MTKTINSTVNSTAIMSDDGLYRYQLTRAWDKQKPKATVIMLNPSKADMLKSDMTAMNVNNFLIDNDYGEMTIVNLFAYMSTDPKYLNEREEMYESLNNNYLKEAFEDADIIIVAWTRGGYITRKREVENLLRGFQGKIKCFADKTGKKPMHPRNLGEGWMLEDYKFQFVD